MPVDPWRYYRAFNITAQGNDTMAGKQQWYFWLVRSPPPHPHPPTAAVLPCWHFPECLPASETPSNTQWHLERRRRKGKKKKKIISVADGTGKMKSLTLWPHLASSSGGSGRSRGQRGEKGAGHQTLDSSTKQKKEIFLKKTTIGGGGRLCRCAAVLLKSVRGRFARLPYPKPQPPPSCKECSFLSWSEERVKAS